MSISPYPSLSVIATVQFIGVVGGKVGSSIGSKLPATPFTKYTVPF